MYIYTNYIHSVLVQDFVSGQDLCEPVSLRVTKATSSFCDAVSSLERLIKDL